MYEKYYNPQLTLEDYDKIVKAKSGHWDKKDKDAMRALQPYFTLGYLETNRSGEIWLTVKGTRTLQAAGCDPLDSRKFFSNSPKLEQHDG